jgi:spore coat protein U-like protein
MRRLCAIFAVALLLVPGLATALNCTITLTPLAFGLYQPGQAAPVDAVANITVRCVAQPGTYEVTIGPGLSGDQLARTMLAGPGEILNYNLYRDAARTQVWGNGTPPSFTVTGSRPRVGQPTVNIHPLYGRVFESQTPDPGNYADNLLVTVLF